MRDYSKGKPPGAWAIFWHTGGAMAVFAGAICVAMTLFATRDLRFHTALETRGVRVAAVFDEKERRVTRDSNGHREVKYYVTVQVPTADGEARLRRTVSQGFFEGIEDGDTRRIRMVPGRTDRIEVQADEFRRSGQSMQYVALAVGLGAIVALWVFGRRTVSALLARRRGQSLRGRVTELRRHRSKNGTRFWLHWEDERGVPGKSLPGKEARFSDHPVGAEIDLYLCPDGRVWWTGDVGLRDAAPTVLDVKR